MAGFETATIEKLQDDFQSDVDPIILTQALFNKGLISETKQHTIHEMYVSCISRDEVNRYLLNHLTANVPLHSTIKCLFSSGYSRLACKVYRTFRDLSKNRVSVISRSHSINRNVHSYFWKLKQMIHDAMFSNPRNALRRMSNSHIEKMNAETDISRKQQLADKCVAILAAEIYSFYDSQSFDLELSQEDMVNEINKLASLTSNEQVTNIVVCGRMANISAFSGEHDFAEQMLVSARASACQIGHCTEFINLLYIEVYVKLWQFEETPTADVRESLMMWGRLGLDHLMEEDEDARKFWKRMFMLRMVYCLLGIGNRANVISSFVKDHKSIVEAQKLLAEFDQVWTGIDTRREMFYCVARSRLCEYLDHIEEALLYIGRAKKACSRRLFCRKNSIHNGI